jgi:NAD(P)-dependent dehydrogenase (short-subunit alcohol dehydrogenase family)
MHVKELLSLKNKVCLITGGAGKYGLCITEALGEADAKVVVASRSIDKSNRDFVGMIKNGFDITIMKVDQGDHSSVIKLKDEIKAKFGRLDVFVNNAVLRPMKTYTSPLEEFAESMRINATGMFDITREMADLIGQSGGGSIVNICSMMGMFGPDLSNYEGTGWDVPAPDYFFHKGGMFTLTRYLARVLADKKVRVNSISPGGIFANQNEQFLKNYTKKVPAGRLANNDDIKGVVVFLASQASEYVNGENILMDGGMHS